MATVERERPRVITLNAQPITVNHLVVLTIF